ncbi:hypothetical protein TNCV_2313091 [Trichonephila clavipes]|nr:hypothetical protein TNCV_2313091 [Trichonephila clavipes]
MFLSWLPAIRMEAHELDQWKPLFLPSHGPDTEKVEEQSRFKIMLSQSKVPIELVFFFMVRITNNNFYLAAMIIFLNNPVVLLED